MVSRGRGSSIKAIIVHGPVSSQTKKNVHEDAIIFHADFRAKGFSLDWCEFRLTKWSESAQSFLVTGFKYNGTRTRGNEDLEDQGDDYYGEEDEDYSREVGVIL